MCKGWLPIARVVQRGGMLAIILSVALCANAVAQLDTSFVVTVEAKTSAHPEAERGWNEAFAIDGQQGASLTLERGKTYAFVLQDVPAIHPFYITTSPVGVGAEPYMEGVTGNFSTGNSTVTITVDDATPDSLFYQCGSHEYMGWRIQVVDRLTIGLETVADGLTSPLTVAQPPGETDRLFIVDQAGQIRIVENGTLLEQPFLDVSDRMVDLDEGYDERGLLGLAFHPQYSDNGRFFVYYSAPVSNGEVDQDHTATISEFQVSDTSANVADPESERILLLVPKPQGNHNGGTLLFGPEGFLFISLGDGGGADDVGPGHVDDWYDANEGGNAQNVEENLLGSILRIDVDGDEPYGIPGDNPFVGNDGIDEIYAYGFRNPYRMAMDPENEFGLLVGDAGQNRWEEVSQVSLGGNYGWNVKEGTHCFSTANPEQDAESCPDVVGAGHPDEGAPLINPVIEYANANREDGVGLVVVGGVVYRGTAVPDLAGKYIFGDWSYDFGAPEGQLFVATPADEGLWPMQTLYIQDREEEELHHYLLGIGQDNTGEVYVLATDSAGPSGSTGVVYRIMEAEGVAAEDGSELPDRVTLSQNYPNPFNPSTTIHFDLPVAQRVVLTVYDVLGRAVTTLFDGVLSAGPHEVTWDARNAVGAAVPSGTYLYRLQTEDGSTSRVMTFVK